MPREKASEIHHHLATGDTSSAADESAFEPDCCDELDSLNDEFEVIAKELKHITWLSAFFFLLGGG